VFGAEIPISSINMERTFSDEEIFGQIKDKSMQEGLQQGLA
jgi:hypothetical protein